MTWSGVSGAPWWEDDHWALKNWCKPQFVQVTKIGTATKGTKAGIVILAVFNDSPD